MLGPQAGGAAMAMQASISHVMHHPLGVFSMLVAISAAVPPLIRRLGLPDLVGLLAAGVVVGPHALNWVDSSSETVRLLSELGHLWPADPVDWCWHGRVDRPDGGLRLGVVPVARRPDGHSHPFGLPDRAQLRRPEG